MTITIEAVEAKSLEICEYQVRRGGDIVGRFDYYLEGASTMKLLELAVDALTLKERSDD